MTRLTCSIWRDTPLPFALTDCYIIYLEIEVQHDIPLPHRLEPHRRVARTQLQHETVGLESE